MLEGATKTWAEAIPETPTTPGKRWVDTALATIGPAVRKLSNTPQEQLKAWLAVQWERQHNNDFASGFARSLPTLSHPESSFQHRVVSTRLSVEVLAGIRYLGLDPDEPFVDWLATDRLIVGSKAWADAISDVLTAFAPMGPRRIRIRWPGTQRPPIAGHRLQIDQHLVAARVRDCALDASVDVRPTLGRAVDLAWYGTFASEFTAWQTLEPSLGSLVSPASKIDLGAALQTGRVVVAHDADGFCGLAACRPASERLFDGMEVLEEFVVPRARGQALGVALQRSLLGSLPDDTILWGTIDGANAPSLRTARRCGRLPVETWWFAERAQERRP